MGVIARSLCKEIDLRQLDNYTPLAELQDVMMVGSAQVPGLWSFDSHVQGYFSVTNS